MRRIELPQLLSRRKSRVDRRQFATGLILKEWSFGGIERFIPLGSRGMK